MKRKYMPEAEIRTPWKTTRRILGLYGEYKLRTFLAVSLMIFSLVLGLWVNLQLEPILNNVTAKNYEETFRYIKIFAIGFFLSTAMNAFSFIMIAITAQKIMYSLREKLFAHIEQIEIGYFDRRNSGDIISVFTNDIDTLSVAIDQDIIKSFIYAFQIFMTLAVLVFINHTLGSVVVGLIVLFGIFTLFISSKANKHSKVRQILLGEVSAFTEEKVENIEIIKAYNAEEQVQKDFDDWADDLQSATIRSNIYSFMLNAISVGIGYIIYGVLSVVGGMMIVAGKLTLGALITYIQITRGLGQPIQELSHHYTGFIVALSAAERIFYILDEEPEKNEGRYKLHIENGEKFWVDKERKIRALGKIEFENVSFSYDGDVDNLIIKDVSLYARPTEKVAVVGPTGAGKTTLTNLLNRFYEVDSGRILIDGIDIKDIRKKSLREVITTILQDNIIFTGSIMENIKYGNQNITDEEVIEMAKRSTAHEFIKELTDGYDTYISPNENMLSKGQLQIISITRAMVSKPLILVLDEATAAMDSTNEKVVQEAFDELMKNTTTIVIAHRLSTIKNSQEILVVKDGAIVEKGDHDNLIKQKGLYYELNTGDLMFV